MRKIRKRNKKEKGFTLVELLIVIAIIAVLTGIAIPNFLGARTKARVGRALTDMRTIATAIEARAIDYGNYPIGTGTLPTSELTQTGLIANIPKDPFVKGQDFKYWSDETTSPDSIKQWVIVSAGPSGENNFDSVTDWNVVEAGPLGGPESAITTGDPPHPPNPWYDPTGTQKDGDDLGYGAIASPE